MKEKLNNKLVKVTKKRKKLWKLIIKKLCSLIFSMYKTLDSQSYSQQYMQDTECNMQKEQIILKVCYMAHNMFRFKFNFEGFLYGTQNV